MLAFNSISWGVGSDKDLIWLSSTSHRRLIELTSKEFGGQPLVMSLKLFLNNYFSVPGYNIVLEEATAILEYCCHE